MIVSRKPLKDPVEMAKDLPVLTTGRLVLRKMRAGDATALFEYASDPEVSRYTVWDFHRSMEDSYRFLNCVTENYRAGRLENWGIAEKSSDQLIGTIGFFSLDQEHGKAEIHYALARRCSGKGLMTEAVRAVLQFGFECLGLNRIQANCMPENTASERVMQKSGMVFEGVMREGIFARGCYHDLKTYAILKKDWEKMRPAS